MPCRCSIARKRAAQLEYEQKLKAAMVEKQQKEDQGHASGGLLALLHGHQEIR